MEDPQLKQKWFAGETISVGIGQGAIAITPVQLMRAVAAISMDGRLVVPHVVNRRACRRLRRDPALHRSKNTPIDTTGWNAITDAMVKVLEPAALHPRHTFRNRYRRQDRVSTDRLTGSARETSEHDDFAQNGWFVGFTPRRNPDIIVVVLFEGGEHGRLAARLATQVIKAYVDKRHRLPPKWPVPERRR